MPHLRKLAPLAAVEQAASGFLADTVGAFGLAGPAPQFGRMPSGSLTMWTAAGCFSAREGWIGELRVVRPLTMLLEEIRHACRLALVAERARPGRVHRPRAGSALAATNDPIN